MYRICTNTTCAKRTRRVQKEHIALIQLEQFEQSHKKYIQTEIRNQIWLKEAQSSKMVVSNKTRYWIEVLSKWPRHILPAPHHSSCCGSITFPEDHPLPRIMCRSNRSLQVPLCLSTTVRFWSGLLVHSRPLEDVLITLVQVLIFVPQPRGPLGLGCANINVNNDQNSFPSDSLCLRAAQSLASMHYTCVGDH